MSSILAGVFFLLLRRSKQLREAAQSVQRDSRSASVLLIWDSEGHGQLLKLLFNNPEQKGDTNRDAAVNNTFLRAGPLISHNINWFWLCNQSVYILSHLILLYKLIEENQATKKPRIDKSYPPQSYWVGMQITALWLTTTWPWLSPFTPEFYQCIFPLVCMIISIWNDHLLEYVSVLFLKQSSYVRNK